MSPNLRTLYQSTLEKYRKFKKRLDTSQASGQFDLYSTRRQNTMLQRLDRLYRRLRELQTQLRLAAVGGVLALTLNTAGAQQLGPFVPNEGNNPLRAPIVDNDIKPVLVDIDGDGDLDLFFGEGNGTVRYFENKGTPEKAKFRERTGSDHPLEIAIVASSAAPAFSDLDDDGDLDFILAQQSYLATVRYFRNNDSDDGVINKPDFTEISGTGTLFENVASGGNDAHPIYVDIDNDGDLDLFIGHDTNSINSDYDALTFYVNNGSVNLPSFVRSFALPSDLGNLVDDFSNTQQNIAPAFVDFDGDTDPDLVVGNAAGILRYFENTGSLGSPVFTERVGASNPFNGFNLGGNSVPTFADIDNDGDKDAIVGSQFNNIRLFENIGGTFTLVTGVNDPFDGVDVGNHSNPEFVDLDADGDLDVVIGGNLTSSPNTGYIQYHENTGDGCFEEKQGTDNPFNSLFANVNHQVPEFSDLNNDGAPDLLLGLEGNTFLYLNTGTNTDPSFGPSSTPLTLPGSVSRFAPTFSRVDADNDIDVVLGHSQITFENLIYYRNTGTVNSFNFDEVTVSSPFETENISNLPVPEFVDIDHDGDEDMFVGISGGTFRFYEKTAPDTFQRFLTTGNPLDGLDAGRDASPAFADIDLDGDLDAFVGTGDGTIVYFENQNEPPIINRSITTLISINENSSIQIDNNLSVEDDTSDDIIMAEISIGNFESGSDLLTFNPLAGISGNFDASSGVLSLSGRAVISDYTTVLRSIRYSTTTDDPVTSKTITFKAYDFDATDPNTNPLSVVSYNIEIRPVNDAPVLTVNPSAQVSYVENDPGVPVAPELTITDPDHSVLQQATITISQNYNPAQDILEFTDQNGITGAFDSTNGVLVLTGADIPLSDYQSALRSVTYRNNSEQPTTEIRTLTFVVNDGVDDSPVATKDLEVIPVNDPPVLTVNSSAQVTYIENEPGVPVAPELTITDPDHSVLQEARITISQNHDPDQDILEFTDQNGITGAFDSQNGEMVLTGVNIPLSDYQSALRSVTYRNNSEQPTTEIRTLTFVVNDGVDDSPVAVKGLEVVSVNVPPELNSPNSGTDLEYTSISTPLVVDESITVEDIDDDDMESAEVSIGNYVTGDELDATSTGSVNSDFNTLTGVLTLTGTASKDNYEQILQSVTFTSDNSFSTRTITFAVNDGEDNSVPYTRAITGREGIEVFNALSPNGDNKNQFLEIAGITSPNRVEIYNRWGDLVFETNDYDNITNRFEGDSDGGKELPSGTYYYKIKVQNEEYTGYLVIKR